MMASGGNTPMATKQVQRYCPTHLERLLLPGDRVCSICQAEEAARAKTTVNHDKRFDQFMTALESCLGVTIWQGHPAYVYQGAPIWLEPCMYDASLLQEALDSGKAEKRVITIAQAYKLSHQIEIVALKENNA
jgi:hypothetical protein